jgi:hypothetical protein
MGEALVQALAWHGAISLDVVLTDGGPLVIDVNPRLVEPRNAWLAGVDLVGSMLALARNEHPDAQGAARSGVRTHQLLLAILGIAHGARPRRGVVLELARAATRRGAYSRGVEELTPIARDPVAAVPVAAAALSVLIRPSWSRFFEGGAVGGYALSPEGWEAIVRVAAESEGAAPPRVR